MQEYNSQKQVKYPLLNNKHYCLRIIFQYTKTHRDVGELTNE